MGNLVTSAGPEPDPPVWKIYDGFDKSTGKVRKISETPGFSLLYVKPSGNKPIFRK